MTGIAAPLLITTDGGQGAQSAIKTRWPATPIQRCLAYVQRVVRRHTTSRPRTPAGKALYRLALKLTAIRDLDQAAAWITRLPTGDTPPPVFKPTTNMLEGGINAMIKNLARAHRGLTGEHQRTVIDW